MIIFKKGSEWAPDSAFGQDIIEIGLDGRVRYENRRLGSAKVVRGRASVAATTALMKNLDEAEFPAVPAHSLPPGGSVVEIIVQGGAVHTVRLDYFAALGFAGYGELVQRLTAWAAWLRNGATPPPDGLMRE